MRKVLSLLLIFTLCMGFSTDFSNASSNEEAIAKNTIEKYFNTKYELLKKANTDKVNALSSFYLNSSENTYSNYEIDRLKYLIESNITSETTLESFTNEFEYEDINIQDSEANIKLTLTTKIKYSYLKEPFVDELSHSISLKKVNKKWLIVKDDYLDELKMLYDLETDFDKIIPDIEENYKKSTQENMKNANLKTIDLENEVTSDSVGILSIPGDSTDYYSSSDRADAVSYARQYTEDTADYSGDSYNNAQFKYFSYANDCQNYVSQCIWYGFGGRSSADKDYPMYSEWWANTSSTSTTWNWTGTSYFYNEITDNYDDYINNRVTGYGVQGYSTTPSNIKEGDYIYVPGHVLFVSKADDTDGDGTVEYNEIEICAHTSNRKDKNLAALYGSVQPSNMEFMHIVRVKWNEAMSLK